MTPSSLHELTRDQILFFIGHEILHRLMEIEPQCLSFDRASGKGSLLATTPEGNFLVALMGKIDTLRFDS
jgi:hypothetical protein